MKYIQIIKLTLYLIYNLAKKLNLFFKISKFYKRSITQGGAVAAPIAGQILSEVIPYLELKQDNEETKEESKSVMVPDIKYKSIKEAEKILKELELNLKIDYDEEIDKEKIILTQIPSAGIQINSGSTIIVGINDNS